VVIAEINEGNAKDVAEAIIGAGRHGPWRCATDVTDPDSCAAMVQAAVDAFGKPSTSWSTNAAIYDGLHMEAFEDLEIAEWERVMAVNVKGTWLATRAVSPIMKAARSREDRQHFLHRGLHRAAAVAPLRSPPRAPWWP